MTAPHILTVTLDPDYDPADEQHAFDLVCPGVTNACRRWEPCGKSDCTVPAEYNFDAREALGHGVHHKYIDGFWMTPTDSCLYVSHDQLSDAAEYLNLPVGRHPVDVDYLGDGDIALALLDKPAKV